MLPDLPTHVHKVLNLDTITDNTWNFSSFLCFGSALHTADRSIQTLPPPTNIIFDDLPPHFITSLIIYTALFLSPILCALPLFITPCKMLVSRRLQLVKHSRMSIVIFALQSCAVCTGRIPGHVYSSTHTHIYVCRFHV